ncbi:hypothetical protein AAG570_001434 [Ranatra chinensis]|uniref:sn-1-specific diacylglycerol lipase ABHD11 n=1 Tax=Ranatra chinensis TaxID=642074 RepID=A0ABD0YUE7_9HEMI
MMYRFVQSCDKMLSTIHFHVSCIFTAKIYTVYHWQANNGEPKLKPLPLAYSSYFPVDSEEGKHPRDLVIILHGLLGSKSNWNSIAKAIVERVNRRVILADARNHGQSPHSDQMSYEHMAEDVRLLLDSLVVKKVDKVCLMGHSMGGRSAMYFALKYPSFVDNIIVVDISPVGAIESIDALVALCRAMKDVVLKPNLSLAEARADAGEQLKPHVRDLATLNFLLTNLVSRREVPGFRWRINLESIVDSSGRLAVFPNVGTTFGKSALFVGAENSSFLKPEDEPYILKLFPRAQFEYVPNSGHLIHVDNPDVLLALIIKFVSNV